MLSSRMSQQLPNCDTRWELGKAASVEQSLKGRFHEQELLNKTLDSIIASTNLGKRNQVLSLKLETSPVNLSRSPAAKLELLKSHLKVLAHESARANPLKIRPPCERVRPFPTAHNQASAQTSALLEAPKKQHIAIYI